MPTTYAIPNGRTVMDATLYTGNSSGATVINTDTGTVGFKPDLVWMKCRTTARNHEAIDSNRGNAYTVFPNLTNAEVSDTRISSFNSNGFTYTSNSNSANNGDTFVAWQWQAGQGTNTTNTSGSITSTVSVNATAGFSIVTYTGNGINNATVGHGLGVTPAMLITKARSTTSEWWTWQTMLGDNVLRLNTTNGTVPSTGNGVYNTAGINSTVFALGAGSINGSGTTYVSYCWAPVAGFSQFGSYTGNGSADGSFVYLGFRPRWVMWKRSDSASGNGWYLLDSARNTYNVEGERLFPNLANAGSSDIQVDFLSNGFKLRTTDTDSNASGGTYIYAAFAENPFKYANAR